jgi:uncharacterized protein YtpQ (UPF0354 family)
MGPVTFGSGVLKTSTHAVILLITLYLVAPAEAAKGTLSPVAFTDLYVAALREQAPDVETRITGALKLSVEWRDSGQHQIFLDNAYTQYETEPADLEKILSTYITASLESIQSADDGFDPARLVPVIKDGGYLDEIRSSLNSGDGGGEDLSLVHERYNDDLIILYAEDTPSNIRYFTEDAVEDLGLAESELRARAIENLRGLLPAIEMRGEDGTYMLTADGNYEASLLLFDDIWVSGQIEVRGELVVAVPARDMLLVTGSEDPGGLELIRSLVAEVMTSSAYRLTDRLFVYRDGRFVRLEQ